MSFALLHSQCFLRSYLRKYRSHPENKTNALEPAINLIMHNLWKNADKALISL